MVVVCPGGVSLPSTGAYILTCTVVVVVAGASCMCGGPIATCILVVVSGAECRVWFIGTTVPIAMGNR